MKYVLLGFALLMTACSTPPVPVKRNFPNAPAILLEKCESLLKVENHPNGVAITELLKTVVTNYALYYECSAKVDGWQDWYKDQKKIHESVK